MRKSRLVILPTKCLNSIGFLLLFLSCPVIGDWGRIQPESEASHNAIQIAREGTCSLKRDLFGGFSDFSPKYDLNVCPFDESDLNINLKSFNSILKSIEMTTCNRKSVIDEGGFNDTRLDILVKEEPKKIEIKPSEFRLEGLIRTLSRKLPKKATTNNRIFTRNFRDQKSFLSRNDQERVFRNTIERKDRVSKRQLQERRNSIQGSRTYEKGKREEFRIILKGIRRESRAERISRKTDIRRRINENSFVRVKRETIERNARNNEPESREIRRFERLNEGSSSVRRENKKFWQNINNIRLLTKTNRFSANERIERSQNQRRERETSTRLNGRRVDMMKNMMLRKSDDRQNLERILPTIQAEKVEKMEKKPNLFENVRKQEDSDLRRIDVQNRRKQIKNNYFRKLTKEVDNNIEENIKMHQSYERNDKIIQNQYHLKKNFDNYNGKKFGEWTLTCLTGIAVYYFTITQSKLD